MIGDNFVLKTIILCYVVIPILFTGGLALVLNILWEKNKC